MNFDPVIHVSCSLILSYIFVVASVHKWQDLAAFRTSLLNYQVLPEALVALFVYLIPLLELLCGLALLIPYSAQFAAYIAAWLLVTYMLVIAVNLLRGRRTIDCGCGGTEQKQAISEWLLLRNAILVFFAYSVTTAMHARALGWYDWFVILLTTAVACLFYNIVNQLLVNRDLLKVFKTHHG